MTRALQGAKVTPLQTGRARHSLPSESQGFSRVKMILALLGMAIVVWGIVWCVLSLIAWGTDVMNTFQYGPTRTSVVSGVFGIDNDSQATPTSIIAINLKGMLVIESIPAGDVSRMKAYPTGLTLVGGSAAKLPILLVIKDVNGDHRPDVLVEIPGQSVPLKLINNGNGFTLTK